MDTKKTIIVSVLTTLATVFVVAVLMHMCSGHCGKRSHCSSTPSHCSAASSHCKSESAKCDKRTSCSKKAMCSKGEKCKDKSNCSKASCDKSKCEKGTKVMEWTSEDGDKVVKKVIKVDIEEEN